MSSHLNPPIQIVLSIWDLADVYNRYAVMVIVSLLENTSSSIEFHLLYDELYNNAHPEWSENRQKYHEIEGKYGAKIIFHHVSVPEWCSAMPNLRFFTLGTLLRLFIPDIPANYELWKYFMTTPWYDEVSILVRELVAVSDLSPVAQSLCVDHLIVLPFGKKVTVFHTAQPILCQAKLEGVNGLLESKIKK